MRKMFLSVGLLVSALVTAAPQEPKVSCNLNWQVKENGVTKVSASKSLEIGKDGTIELSGFSFSGRLDPQFLGTRLIGYQLATKVSQGESTAFRADYTQINVRQSLGLAVGNESAIVNCDVTAK